MSKRIFLILISLILTFNVSWSIELLLDSSYVSVMPDNVLSIDVKLGNVSDVYNIDFNVAYPTDSFEPYDIDETKAGYQGEALKENFTDNYTTSAGNINVVMTSVSSVNFSENESIVRLYMKVKSTAAAGTKNISCSGLKINNNSVTSTYTGLSIDVTTSDNVSGIAQEEQVIFGADGMRIHISSDSIRSTDTITTSRTTLATEGYLMYEPVGDSYSEKSDLYYKIVLASDSTLSRAATVYFPFNTADIPTGFEAENMKVYRFNESSLVWERIGGKVIENTNLLSDYYIETTLSSFSLFAIIADRYEYTTNNINNISASPSPFSPNGNGINDVLTIKYNLNNTSFVTLKIYDRTGFIIKDLIVNEEKAAGDNSVEWDGIDSYGNTVPTGIYMYHFNVMDSNGKADKKTGTFIVSNNMVE